MTIESVTANAGSGGSSFAADAITGGTLVPLIKIMSATDGSEELIGGDAANGLDVDVTRVSGTVAVSSTTLATVAKQPALGTAGTASADVISIQGIASMTKLLVTPDLPTGAATSAKQDTGNTSLASIDGKITAVNTGAVVISSGTTTVTQATGSNLHTVIDSGTVTTLTTLTGGAVAHDGADSGNPIKIGARAINAEITAVSNNDRSDLVTDLVGKLLVLPYANPENFVSGAITSAMTGTTSTSLLAAPASGLRNYITQITVSCAHATQGTDVAIQDGNGGTTLYTIPAAALYGGAVVVFPTPLRQPTTATAIYCANVTTGSSTKVSASGYTGK